MLYAAAEVEKYRATLAELGADRQIKEYFLKVAENYGDQLRAAKLRAELADLGNKQADAQRDLSKAQSKASKTLTGNSDAAIENRSTVLDMVDSYRDLLKTYAANGMSQADLQRKAAQLKAEFIAQATQAGFSRVEIEKYATSFDGVAAAIGRVPRNISVSFNPDPALQALAEFEAKARKAGSSAGAAYGGGFGAGAGNSLRNLPSPTIDLHAAERAGLLAGRAIRKQVINGIDVIKIGNKYLDSGQNSGIYGYASGGYTGGGGVNQVAGVIHGQEYVMSAPAVRTLGVNGMNFMHNMLKSGRIPAFGVGNQSGMVELSPFDRQLLVDIRSAVGITIGAQTLQATSNGANANDAQRRRG